MKKLSNAVTLLIMLFLYAPLAVMIVYSFNSGSSTSVMQGFSFKWYLELLNDSVTIESIKNTLILAGLSSVVATVLGTIAAVGIFNMRNKIAKSTIMTVTNLPMMNPDIVTGVSMMLLFIFVSQALGLINSLSFWTLLIAHVTFNLPYVILNVLPKLYQTDKHLAEAAEDLGCTPFQSFFKVILPSISSGILTGFMMAFTLSLDDFVISYFTSGPDFQTLPIIIYSKVRKSVKPDMYALSSIMFLVVLMLLVFINIAQIRSERKTIRKS